MKLDFLGDLRRTRGTSGIADGAEVCNRDARQATDWQWTIKPGDDRGRIEVCILADAYGSVIEVGITNLVVHIAADQTVVGE